MIEIRMEKQGEKKAILHINGELTINNVRDLYEKVCEELTAPDELTVHIGSVTAIDCTFMQVLCSAHRAYTEKGKHFDVIFDDCGIVERSGWSGVAPGSKCVEGFLGKCFLNQED